MGSQVRCIPPIDDQRASRSENRSILTAMFSKGRLNTNANFDIA